MPPTLRLDPAAVRRAVIQGWRAVEELVGRVPDPAFEAPTRLGTWRVAELVGHMAHNPSHLRRMLDAAATVDVPSLPSCGLLDYYDSRVPEPAIAERGQRQAAGKSPGQLRAELQELTAEAVELLERTPDEAVLVRGRTTILLSDYLPTRCVEACVHSLDLAAATGLDPGLPAPAVGVTARLLAAMLARQAPGRSVELRVPPHAAVQVVEGPRHTRGTPPNVVEMAGPTWLEVATGRVGFAAAVAAGRIAASGERADLSPYLPVLA